MRLIRALYGGVHWCYKVILLPALEVCVPNGIWAINGSYEFPMLWIFMQVVLAILGPGAFAMRTFKRFDTHHQGHFVGQSH